MGPRKLQPDKQDVPHVDTIEGDDSDEDFDPIAEMMAQEAEDDEATLREDEQALLESAAGDGYENELELLRTDQDIPVDKLKEMFGFDANRTISTSSEHSTADASTPRETSPQGAEPAEGDRS